MDVSPPILYPPNRPLERAPQRNTIPSYYDCTFFLDINEKGELVSGHSNISGAFWESVLYYYKEETLACSSRHTGYYIACTTTADAKFINDSKVILAEDTGKLKVLAISDAGDPTIICEQAYKANARIEQVSTWYNKDKFVACADTSVLLANIEINSELDEYKNYHTDLVTSVSANSKDVNLFATTSYDRRACIWDERTPGMALVLYRNEFSGLLGIDWNPSKMESLLVGSEAGDIYSLDMRKPKEFFSSRNCFKAKIHRVAFSPSGRVAVCGDVCRVLVLNGDENLETVYESEDYLGFMRGLAWHQDALYTCGFDKCVVKHVF